MFNWQFMPNFPKQIVLDFLDHDFGYESYSELRKFILHPILIEK